MSERRIYQVTEADEKRAAKKREKREADVARADKALSETEGKAHRKAALNKRNACKLLLQGDVEWHRGRGQGIIDRLMGLDYHEERPNAAYNAGYYDGWHFSRNELRDYLAANENFIGLL